VPGFFATMTCTYGEQFNMSFWITFEYDADCLPIFSALGDAVHVLSA
jgi:hypothetical protein